MVFSKALRRLSRSLSKLKSARVTYRPPPPRKPEGRWAHVLNTDAGEASVPPTATGKPARRCDPPRRPGDPDANSTRTADTPAALQQNRELQQTHLGCPQKHNPPPLGNSKGKPPPGQGLRVSTLKPKALREVSLILPVNSQ